MSRLLILKIDEDSLGPEHQEVATNLSNLGSVLFLEGKHDQAGPELRRSLSIYMKIFGPENVDTKQVRSKLAKVSEKLSSHRQTK